MRKQLTCLFAAGALLVVPGFVFGQSDFTGGGDGVSWEDAANWSDGIPSGVNADIEDGFAVTLVTDQSVNDLDVVGDQSSGVASLEHTAGTVTSSSWVKVGGAFEDTTSVGEYNLSGTASVSTFVAQIGFLGGTGTLSVSDSASVDASVAMNIAGGNINALEVAQNSIATLNISDNATLTVGRLNMGAAGSVATVNQTGGSLLSSTWVAMSNFGSGMATYNISGGSLTANDGNIAVGQEGPGELNISGTAVVLQMSGEGNKLVVGGVDDPGFAQDGMGMLNITGSLASITCADFEVAATAGSEGTVSWTADADGITTIVSADNSELDAGTARLVLDLSADPASTTAGTEYLLVDNGAAVAGTFEGLAEGATVSIGGENEGTISYVGGTDGFDIVVTAVGGAGLIGDFNGDMVVDCDDLDSYIGILNTSAAGQEELNLVGGDMITLEDANFHIANLVVTTNGIEGTFPGDADCSGTVDVLGDAFILVGSLGLSGRNFGQGDFDFNGTVDVLGDAFILVGNLGMSNESPAP